MDSIGASQAFEALYGHFAGACDELDELGFISVAELFQHFPEPLDNFWLFIIILVNNMFFQVLDIHSWEATNEKL